jgi:hypothetical protein
MALLVPDGMRVGKGEGTHKAQVGRTKEPSLIGALEAPEPGVTVVAAIGPNECQAEPDALDETRSSRSPHGTALADGALRDSFGKREMHGNRLPSVSLSMRKVRPFIADGAAPWCAGDILTVRTAMVACTVREGYWREFGVRDETLDKSLHPREHGTGQT